MPSSEARVLALVLTFDAPDTLHACVQALLAQHRPPDEIVVIDNASEPSADVSDLHPSMPLRVLRMSENLGPAGGHAAGLAEFLSSTHDHAWVFDDDFIADPGCLAAQLDLAEADPRSVIFPKQFAPDGAPDDMPRWAGVLIPRAAVETAGLPMAELFWWIEDTEYLQRRLPKAGFPGERAEDASVTHGEVRRVERKPDWKIYYETRNTVYYRLQVQRGRRAWKMFRYLARVISRILSQPGPRSSRFRMVGRGVWDGLRGRLGKTIDPPRA